MKSAITLFTLVATLFIALGANRVLEQQRQLTAARPVPGTVLSSEARPASVAEPSGRRKESGAFVPWVRYRYALDGIVNTDMRVFPPPLANTTTRARAERIVADFPPGKAVTVWYAPPKDPANPQQGPTAFLLREWSFEPYLVILLSMIHLSIGMALWASRPWTRDRLSPPKPTTGNWHELAPRVDLVTRRHPWRAVSLAWYVIGGVTIGHYFVNADRPYATLAIVASFLYAIAGVFPVSRWLYHRRFARTFRDARVLANTDAFRLGKTFDVRVEQAYRRPAKVESLRVALMCDETRGRWTRRERPEAVGERDEVWADVETSTDVDRERPLTARTKLTPPADDPPSTEPGQPANPRVSWRIVVEVKVARLPAYRTDYPITVVAGR